MYENKYSKYLSKILAMTGGTYEQDFCDKLKKKYNLKFLDFVVFRKALDKEIFMYVIFKNGKNAVKEFENFMLKFGNHNSNLYYDTLFDTHGYANTHEISNSHMKIIFNDVYGIPYNDIISKLNIIESKPVIINSKRCIIGPIQKNDYDALLPVWTDPDNIQQHGYHSQNR